MLFCFRFKNDINEQFAWLAPDAQVKTLEDIIKSGKSIRRSRSGCSTARRSLPLSQSPRCDQVAQNMRQMRESVQKVMDENTLDALVYPTWAFPRA